ncbi:SseB family protein [Mobilicoccus pelagius]|uniref:SseB protein N-terminal domain-containing protein n=1 Tax=Mobilicoccus pelagius NBRC 104925 TaxID=1089455 RepID=H5UPJ1_9MICO|nr:SseB family protein [Mobilicoccus pelagius]GAB47649.1 hypothetical protein MOPEL_022_00180 [Mobilicoccus pelagius NBRC 104925]
MTGTTGEPVGHEHGHVPGGLPGADSGGIAFAGRHLDAATFAGDDGRSDPALVDALTDLTRVGSPEHVRRVMDLLAHARVLVPIVATPSSAAAARHGVEGEDFDDSAQMATVTLTAPDGRRAFPVFTGVEAVTAWDPQGRPTPKLMPEVARTAVEEGCDTLLVDLGSPHAAVLRLPHLWALAQERPWLPPHEDPVVKLAVAEAAQGIDGLVRARAEDGTALHGPGVLRLVLVLRPGLDQRDVDTIVTLVGERLAAEPEVRIRIADLAVALHRGEAGEPAPPSGEEDDEDAV